MTVHDPKSRLGEPKDRLTGKEGLAHGDRMKDPRRRSDGRAAGWLVPAVLAAAVIAGIVGLALSLDWEIAPDTTTGQTTGSPPASEPAKRQ
jgi:hypothetical protein